MQVLKNPFSVFKMKVRDVFLRISGNLVARSREIAIESAAHARSKQLVSRVSIVLEQHRHAETGYPLTMTVRDLGRDVRCEDQIDLETALEELIARDAIVCFEINGATIESLQNWGDGHVVSGEELSHLPSDVDFWNLRVMSSSLHPVLW